MRILKANLTERELDALSVFMDEIISEQRTLFDLTSTSTPSKHRNKAGRAISKLRRLKKDIFNGKSLNPNDVRYLKQKLYYQFENDVDVMSIILSNRKSSKNECMCFRKNDRDKIIMLLAISDILSKANVTAKILGCTNNPFSKMVVINAWNEFMDGEENKYVPELMDYYDATPFEDLDSIRKEYWEYLL